MKRNFVTVLVAFVLLVVLGGRAEAMEPGVVNLIPELTFDGITVNCEVRITGIGKQIFATLELWQGSTLIASWDGTATSRLTISESCVVEKGKTYTLMVSGVVGGEAISGTPVSATCK